MQGLSWVSVRPCLSSMEEPRNNPGPHSFTHCSLFLSRRRFPCPGWEPGSQLGSHRLTHEGLGTQGDRLTTCQGLDVKCPPTGSHV